MVLNPRLALSRLPRFLGEQASMVDNKNTDSYEATDAVPELRDVLRLILPMAKGYATAHPVGNNAHFVGLAEEVLARVDRHGL